MHACVLSCVCSFFVTESPSLSCTATSSLGIIHNFTIVDSAASLRWLIGTKAHMVANKNPNAYIEPSLNLIIARDHELSRNTPSGAQSFASAPSHHAFAGFC